MSTSLTMILDSGTTHHMSGNKGLFTTYSTLPSLAFVILGDGVTTIQTSGEGAIDYLVEGYRIILHDVYYAPAIQDTL